MAPKVKKFCKREVRRDLERVKCGAELRSDGECKNKSEHIWSLMTGMCASRWCEGLRAKDFKGRPVKTCHFMFVCPCDCHDKLDKIARLTESPRVLEENPEYRRYKSPYWMPTPEEIVRERVLSSAGDVDVSPALEGTTTGLAGGPVDVTTLAARRTFAPTPTGRAARGQLETWVDTELREWDASGRGGLFSPAYVSEVLAEKHGVKPPSVGAIDAAFKRFHELGYAELAKKPTRLVGLTPEGKEKGLLVIKEMRRHAKKSVATTKARLI